MLLRALKSRPQPFHGFGIIDAHEQAQIPQPPLEDHTVQSQELVGNRHSRRWLVNTEPITIMDIVQKFLEGYRPEASLIAGSQDVNVHEIIEYCVGEHQRSKVSPSATTGSVRIASYHSLRSQTVWTASQQSRVEEFEDVGLGVLASLQERQSFGETPHRARLCRVVSQYVGGVRIVLFQPICQFCSFALGGVQD